MLAYPLCRFTIYPFQSNLPFRYFDHYTGLSGLPGFPFPRLFIYYRFKHAAFDPYKFLTALQALPFLRGFYYMLSPNSGNWVFLRL